MSILQKAQENSNPFNFPRPGDSINGTTMYKTGSEISKILKTLLMTSKEIKLPDVKCCRVCGEMLIRESFTFNFTDIDYHYEGKSKIPKYLVLRCDNYSLAVFIKKRKSCNFAELNDLNGVVNCILVIDLTWAKDGVTEDELRYLVQTDVGKKYWFYHELIPETEQKLKYICEPITFLCREGFHSYFKCTLTSKHIEYHECFCCPYRYINNYDDDEEDLCFGKSKVQTYNDLLSITHVEREENKIVSITYNIEGEEKTVNFPEEKQTRGKTLLQLWNERTGNEIIAINIYTKWIVLINEDPLENHGYVYGKICKDIRQLRERKRREISSAYRNCWETFNEQA